MEALKRVYLALVVSQLEYASIIWSPFYHVHCVTLERVQNKFLRFCSFKFGHQVQNHDYSIVLQELDLKLLQTRRIHKDLCYAFKLLNGMVACPELLESVNFHVPNRNLRHSYLFFIPSNYGKHTPLERTLKLLNDKDICVFGVSYDKFKKSLNNGARHTYSEAVGKNVANPTAMLLCASKLLRHVNLPVFGDMVRNAVDKVLQDGRVKTKDIGGQSSTQEFTYAVINNLQMPASKK